MSLGAIYCLLLEHIFCNFLPGTWTLYLVDNTYIPTVIIWFILAVVQVTIDHFGEHIVHHCYCNSNYSKYIMDYIFNTKHKSIVSIIIIITHI
jgi:hypothetical protein